MWDYEPYGDDWHKTMMGWSKEKLVASIQNLDGYAAKTDLDRQIQHKELMKKPKSALVTTLRIEWQNEERKNEPLINL
jgi:hypothetical protein